MLKQSRSILCKIHFEDINNFCLFNPFRLSKGLIFLFSKYFNLTKLELIKKSRIFYKKLLLSKNRFKHHKYFKKIKLIKKRLLLFFGFKTNKQLNYLFNNIYQKKTIFLFYYLLNFLEFRYDFFLYRLRFVFSLIEARNFIQKYGLFINYQLNFDFNNFVKIGDIVTFPNVINFYLKFYRFWFNEYVYSQKFIKINYLQKFLILKKLKKKLNLKFKFFKFKFNLLKKEIFVNQKKLKIIHKKEFLVFYNNLYIKFKKKIKIFFFIENLLFIFTKIFYLYIIYYCLTTFNILNFALKNIFFIHKKFDLKKKFYNLEYKKNYIKLSRGFSIYLFNYLNLFIKLNFFKFNQTFLKKFKILNLDTLYKNNFFIRHSILVSSKHKYIKFISFLKTLSLFVFNKKKLFNYHKIEKHRKLRGFLKSFFFRTNLFFYKLKGYFSKYHRRLNYRLIFVRSNKSKKFINLHYCFYFIYFFINRLFKYRYLKQNKLCFFSTFKRLNHRFKFLYVHNKNLFEKFDRPKRLLIFLRLLNFSIYSYNFFQHKLLSLFKNFVFTRENNLFFENYKIKLEFFKFFFLYNRVDFYNCIFKIKKRYSFFKNFNYLQRYSFLRDSFLKIKFQFLKCFFFGNKTYLYQYLNFKSIKFSFNKNLKYVNKYVSFLNNLVKTNKFLTKTYRHYFRKIQGRFNIRSSSFKKKFLYRAYRKKKPKIVAVPKKKSRWANLAKASLLLSTQSSLSLTKKVSVVNRAVNLSKKSSSSVFNKKYYFKFKFINKTTINSKFKKYMKLYPPVNQKKFKDNFLKTKLAIKGMLYRDYPSKNNFEIFKKARVENKFLRKTITNYNDSSNLYFKKNILQKLFNNNFYSRYFKEHQFRVQYKAFLRFLRKRKYDWQIPKIVEYSPFDSTFARKIRTVVKIRIPKNVNFKK